MLIHRTEHLQIGLDLPLCSRRPHSRAVVLLVATAQMTSPSHRKSCGASRSRPRCTRATKSARAGVSRRLSRYRFAPEPVASSQNDAWSH